MSKTVHLGHVVGMVLPVSIRKILWTSLSLSTAAAGFVSQWQAGVHRACRSLCLCLSVVLSLHGFQENTVTDMTPLPWVSFIMWFFWLLHIWTATPLCREPKPRKGSHIYEANNICQTYNVHHTDMLSYSVLKNFLCGNINSIFFPKGYRTEFERTRMIYRVRREHATASETNSFLTPKSMFCPSKLDYSY